MDGWITIGTELSTDKFDRQIAGLEKKMQKEEEKKVKIKTEVSNIRQQVNDFNDLITKAEEYKQVVDEISNEQARRLGQGLKPLELTSNQQETISKYLEMKSYIDENVQSMQRLANKGNDLLTKQKEINDKVQEYKTRIENVKLQKQVAEVEQIKKGFGNVGSAIQKAVSKAGRLALSIFGIRAAVSALRSASSDLANYDQQYAANLEYIRFVLTQAIAPILRGIVQLAMQLLQYINMIASAWFGVNLFANGSAESFRKMKAGASGVSKAVKEIKKQLMGFDEINMLNSQSDTGTSAGAGGVGMPDFDLSSLQGEVPKWLQWILDNRDIVLGFLAALAVAIAGFKLAKWFSGVSNAISTVVSAFGKFIKTGASLTAGIGMMVAGVVTLVTSIAMLVLNWEKLDTKQKAILIALAALGAAFITFGYAIATGLSVATLGIGAIIAAVVALVTALVALIVKFATEEKSIKSVENAEKSLVEAQKELEEATDSYIDSVDRAEEAQKKLEEAQKRTGLSGEDLFKQVQSGALDYANMTAEQREVYKAYLENEKAQKQLKESTEALAEAKQKEKIASWENKLAVAAEKDNFDEYKKAVVEAFKKGELSAEEARDLIGKSMSEMSRDAQQTFMEDLPGDIKEGLDPKNYETMGQKLKKWFSDTWDKIKEKFSEFGSKIGEIIGNAFKKVINKILEKVEDRFNNPIRQINNAIGFINQIPGVNIGYVPTLSLPRLKAGGIINMPNKGTLVGTSAIGGEAGREGVVPLTDQQAMAELGREIGKNVLVNLTNITSMNGRVISRELKQIDASQQFAYNT